MLTVIPVFIQPIPVYYAAHPRPPVRLQRPEPFRRWPSVRRGEERTFSDCEADIMFNSSVYELAVLKQFAVPLLKKISPTEPEYVDAKRLLLFLSCFVPLEPHDIPNNSILREFIGGSCFPVS